MLPKPRGLAATYGEQFSDLSVVAAYHLRPPYPEAVIARLSALAGPKGSVLDLGCGTGEISRRLIGRVGRIDAVDPSAAMLDMAHALPGGDAPGLNWIQGRAEDAPLDPPYDLVYAAASLHWMDWAIVLPRLRSVLIPTGLLAIVGDGAAPVPWATDAQVVIDRYSTNRDYRPYNLITELTERGLFQIMDQWQTEPVPFRQPIHDYVNSFHARNGFSRDRMAPAAADAFDRELTAIVARHATDGFVHLSITGQIITGLPSPDL